MRALGSLLAGSVIVALVAAVAATPAGGKPRCYGAAARDPHHPCFNPTRSFTPSVKHVDDVAASRCKPTGEAPEPVCAFGVSERRARDHVALIGDSHALHWRGALDVVARSRRWRAYSVTAPGCFFSEAVRLMAEGAREPCTEWYEGVRRWIAEHPEVSTVFVSQNATTPVLVRSDQTYLGVKAAGFRGAWRRLPKTVRNVVVIRDTPDPRDDLFACVERVRKASSGRPGLVCRTPRRDAMHWDTAVTAASQVRSRRYRSVDMTRYFCGNRNCYPVVGGSLVFRDVLGHLSVAYSTSLGPYLARKVRALRLR